MSKKRIKQYLMLLTVVGLVAIAAGGGNGTFASFTAQVTNQGNTFASGTLFLHNTAGVTSCTSESNSLNVNPGTGVGGDHCAVLFNASDFQASTPQTASIELDNAGTINATDIKFSVSGCTWGDNHLVTLSNKLFGTTPTCDQMWLTVQETSSLGGSDVYCAYGPTSNGTDCLAPDNSANFLNSTSFNPLQTTGPVNADLAVGTPRYYTITIVPDSSLLTAGNNTLQNRTVAFDLNWKIDQ